MTIELQCFACVIYFFEEEHDIVMLVSICEHHLLIDVPHQPTWFVRYFVTKKDVVLPSIHTKTPARDVLLEFPKASIVVFHFSYEGFVI